ncbi:5-methylcytosine-specific restriction endonuclease McrA [Metapseudomonas resinovorans]|uniref:HNH endonuclease n=1 Tax=Metapseudomonas resinovorans TaxID=53412 RepID=UPI003D1FEFA5
MPARKPLTKPRAQAFKAQGGRCFYCGVPMWQANPEHFAASYGLTMKQVARLQCTGEHLVAHKDGGGVGRDNIVAACRFCNRGRHARKTDLSPDKYAAHVRKRLDHGAWHPPVIQRLLTI